jgi:hypothetical protein
VEEFMEGLREVLKGRPQERLEERLSKLLAK